MKGGHVSLGKVGCFLKFLKGYPGAEGEMGSSYPPCREAVGRRWFWVPCEAEFSLSEN
jgi:hypothetical protein